MIQKTLHRITGAMNICSIIALVAILLLMFFDIVLRHTLKVTILGAYEIIEYLMVIVIGFCLAHTEMLDGHVRVTMLTEKLPHLLNKIIRFIGYLLQTAMLIIITVANIQQAQYIERTHEASAIHKIPAFPFYYIVAIGFGIFALAMLLRAVQTITPTATTEQEN